MSEDLLNARIAAAANGRTTDRVYNSVAELPSVWDMDVKLNWLIPDLIPESSLNLLTAESGAGKSWFAYAIAGAVAHGKDFLDHQVVQRPVLYCDGENPPYVVKQRLDDLGIAKTDRLKVWLDVREHPAGPDDDRILTFAQRERPLIIWDSLAEFNSAADENSATDMRKVMSSFKRVRDLGATVIVIHHKPKEGGQSYRGSSDIKAAIDNGLEIENPNTGKLLTNLTLTQFKSRIAVVPAVQMKFTKGEGFTLIARMEQAVPADIDSAIRDVIVGMPGCNNDYVKLALNGRFGKNRIDKRLAQAVYWTIGRSPEGGRGKAYYPKPEETAPVI